MTTIDPRLILAIDQGTSATKGVLVDAAGAIVAKASVALGEQYPQPGWVEQDAKEIWRSVQQAVADCLAQRPGAVVAAVAFSTQRESALFWHRASGEPATQLLSWQDQRTAAGCDALRSDAVEAMVRARSGLPLDPMFSAAKARWMLDAIDPQRELAKAGGLCFGTVDSFLLARLGAGHVIEVGNASRTQLLNVHTQAWDDELLALFGVPLAVLPKVVPSIGPFGDAGALHPSLEGVKVQAVMADSHAALFAHGAGAQVKATLGTGSSVMALTDGATAPHPGLCLTIAWDAGRGAVQALEGNIRAAGATLRWIADLFGMSAEEAAQIASRSSSGGVSLVPGFNGLGAPWWDARAVGLISGLTLGTDRANLLCAALESIAHQVADVLEAMDATHAGGGGNLARLHVDGGPSRNSHLLDTLAAFTARPVVQCADPELSALGAAHLAGLAAGVWTAEALQRLPRAQHETRSTRAAAEVHADRLHWARAVRQSRHVGEPGMR